MFQFPGFPSIRYGLAYGYMRFTIMNHTMEGAQGRFDAFMNSMKSSYDIVSSNRKELSSGIITEKEEDAAPETDGKNA